VGVATGRAEAAPQQIHALLERIRAAQAAEPSPSQLGRAVGQPPIRD
jgi:hypothetical protein